MLPRSFHQVPSRQSLRRAGLLALAVLVALAPASASGELITGFEGFPLGQNGVTLFRQPSFSGSTDQFLAAAPNLSVVTDERASSGTQSLLGPGSSCQSKSAPGCG